VTVGFTGRIQLHGISLYSIVQLVKSMRLSWVRLVAVMGEARIVYGILLRKLLGQMFTWGPGKMKDNIEAGFKGYCDDGSQMELVQACLSYIGLWCY
jgi:hypothetical protein